MNPMETWAFGYALTRGYPAPGAVPTGLWLEVGKPDQRGRFVLPRFDPAILPELARSIEERNIYIEIPAPRETAMHPAYTLSNPDAVFSPSLTFSLHR